LSIRLLDSPHLKQKEQNGDTIKRTVILQIHGFQVAGKRFRIQVNPVFQIVKLKSELFLIGRLKPDKIHGIGSQYTANLNEIIILKRSEIDICQF
jgi:hypothetical protein